MTNAPTRRTRAIATTSVFAALAITLTLVKAEIPYPVLPYLKFDLAEIPVMTLFFMLGPYASMAAEVIHWITLSIARGDIIGPLMKFLAVTPMILGAWIGVKLARGQSGKLTILLACVFGAVVRIIITSIANIVMLLAVAPGYLSFAGALLRAFGIPAHTDYEALAWTLLFTGIYNAVHVVLSEGVAYWLVSRVLRLSPVEL